jgi:PKD repeat protein
MYYGDFPVSARQNKEEIWDLTRGNLNSGVVITATNSLFGGIRKNGVLFHKTRLPISRRMVLLALIFLLALSVLLPPAAAAWYDSNWLYRQNITINKVYVNGTGITLTNFPVLVNIQDTNLISNAQSNGNDILFTASDGVTILNYEIENFTQSSGNLIAWVKVPSVYNTTNTTFYMYYGNPSASNQQNAAGVWDSKYMGVWHLGNLISPSSDSTSNNYSATWNNNPTPFAGSIIDGGLNLGGFNQNYLSTNYVQTSVTAYNVEAWLKTSNTSQLQTAIVNDRGSAGSGTSLTLSVGGTYPGAAGTAGDVAFGVDSNNVYIGVYTTKVVNDNNWHHIVGTWNTTSGTAVAAGQFAIYIDGVPVATTAVTTGTAPTAPISGSGGTLIGYHQTWNTYLNATLDEIRISNNNRTPVWISTEYNNQKSPNTFLTVYPQEYSTISSGFTGSPTYGIPPMTVQFNVTNMDVIANNASWVNWTWGDGSVSNTSTPLTFNASHTYSSAGIYAVSESVASPGATSITTFSNYITAASSPPWTNANGCWTATYGNNYLVMWNATVANTWPAPYGINSNLWYLVIGGGGGGGSYGGGGGAGGFLNGTFTVSPGSTYTVAVGSGGTAGTTTAKGGNGGNSSFANTTPTNGFQAMGGGGGGSSSNTAATRNGGNGGSGGGGARGTGTAGTGIAGQGMGGGTGQSLTFPTRYLGGGGGGGTVLGGTSTGTAAGNGGNGTVSLITGTSTTYAGGGGGGAYAGLTAGSGGAGGGGAGSSTGAGTAGAAYTGGGGGGGNSAPSNGGGGGSGTVIIRYAYDPTLAGFTQNKTSGLAPLAVQFNLTNMNNNAAYVCWTWGDGAVSNMTPPKVNFNQSHTYTLNGTYTILETAANPVYTANAQNTLTVYGIPFSGFTANVTSGVTPLAVQFNWTRVEENATMWNWSFGDGSAWFNTTDVSQVNATHIYTTSGTYTVTQIVANPYSTSTATGSIQTSSPSVAITLNEGSIALALVAGSSATDSSLVMNTTTNVPFAILVADGTVRNTTQQGYMGSYTSGAYDSGGPDLGSPLQLAGTTTGTTTAQTITPPITSTAKTLYSGSAAVTNQNLPTVFTQPAAYSDPYLPGGSTYRIDLAFIIQTV